MHTQKKDTKMTLKHMKKHKNSHMQLKQNWDTTSLPDWQKCKNMKNTVY